MRRTIAALTVLVLSCASLVALACRPAEAVSFRPDVEARLQTEGRWQVVVRGIQAARERRLDQPPATARGWLPAEAGKAQTERQAIVILVDFDDNPADWDNYPPGHYVELLFSEDTYPTGSMRDWYLENSYGTFAVTGQVVGWYRMPELYSYYVDGQAGFGSYPHNAQKLAEDAVAAADPDVDFSQFDNDGPDGIPNSGDDDGIVDALFVVHAGPGRETTGSDDDIHSHAWVMSQPQPVDGVYAWTYSMEPEDGQRGVFGHEFGHVLGLPDLYDTDGTSSGIGAWGMMSYGSWGNGGLTPVHFIAWCKARLGFLDPTTPQGNLQGVDVPQVETNPVAYVLWTNGLPDAQYFMLENRQRVGSDVSLPGDGILIYHIDETVPSNQDESHPLVAVEQADGLFQLEQGEPADDGDPFPGSTGNYEFSGTSVPSSDDYDGQPTQVAVYLLTPSQETMQVDLVVETEPNVILASWALDDTQGGDGDHLLDPGETVDLVATVRNIGTEVFAVTGTLSEPGGQGLIITQSETQFGDLGADTEAPGDPPFTLSLDAGSTLDAVVLDLSLAGVPDYTGQERFYVGIRDSLVFFTWEHERVTPGYVDQWHISDQRNHTPGGLYCWKFGDTGPGNYANRSDGALLSAPIGVGPNTTLRFWHWIEAETQSDTEAWDGGILEVSVEGGPWTQIEPVGGYPYTILPNPDSPFPGGTPCFSGHSTDWEQVEVDLSGLGQWVQIRWRFGSDAYVTDKGWYIDDVTVEGATTSSVADLGDAAVPLLAAPWPNPTAGVSEVRLILPAPSVPYRLVLYDASGRSLGTLASGRSPAAGAELALRWDGRLPSGIRAAAGVYVLRLEVPGYGTWTRKLVRLR
jgi:immune inhibitor A